MELNHTTTEFLDGHNQRQRQVRQLLRKRKEEKKEKAKRLGGPPTLASYSLKKFFQETPASQDSRC